MSTTFDEIQYAIDSKIFTAPKPIEEPSAEERILIKKLESEGNLMKTRKDDGHGHLVGIGKARDIDLYSSGLAKVTASHPRILADLWSLNLPEKTLICSEISRTVEGIQDRYAVKTSEERRLKFETRGEYLEMAFFNTLMWHGEDARKWSNWDRYQCLLEHVHKQGHRENVRMIQLLEMTLDDAVFQVEKNKWEGLVISDKNATTDFAIGTVGASRPDEPRPDGSWKKKKGFEVDFVAYAFERSTAPSWYGAVKEFSIGLIDPVSRKLIPCGVCGTGMTKQERFEYTKPGKLPVAVEVKFESWSKVNHVPNQPRLKRFRDDKTYEQCLATKDQMSTVLTKERIDPAW